jgi:type IV secretory pathway VirB4 component
MRLAPPHQPHRASGLQVSGAYPFMAEGGLGCDRVFAGTNHFGGGSFAIDGWDLYERGEITSPNVTVSGTLGSGKSSVVKTVYVVRQLPFGRKACILDAKENDGRGEYAPICDWLGIPSIRLEPGSRAVRINPLDIRFSRHQDRGRIERDQLRILQAVIGAALAPTRDGAGLMPAEETASRLALQVVNEQTDGQPILAKVAEAMLDLPEKLVRQHAKDPERLFEYSYQAALALGNLCGGPLQGMFDSATTEGIDLSMPVLDIDLTGMLELGEQSLGILMVCLQAWLRRAFAVDRANWVVVNEEAWYVLGNLATARWMRWSYKMARALGIQNVLVVHSFADLQAAGPSGSEQVQIALGLVRDCDTHIVYRQDTSELTTVRERLRLTDEECHHIDHLQKGQGIWRIKNTRRFLVEHQLSSAEAELVNTNARMAQTA